MLDKLDIWLSIIDILICVIDIVIIVYLFFVKLPHETKKKNKFQKFYRKKSKPKFPNLSKRVNSA